MGAGGVGGCPGKELRTAEVSPHTESDKLRILAMVEIMLRTALVQRAEWAGNGAS